MLTEREQLKVYMNCSNALSILLEAFQDLHILNVLNMRFRKHLKSRLGIGMNHGLCCFGRLNSFFCFSTSLSIPFIQLNLATSRKGGLGSYIGICGIVATFGVVDALVKGGMMGDLSFMCPEFIQDSPLPIFKYYRTKAAEEGSKTVAADLAAAGNQKEAV
ncbi:hypothetical protein RND71_035276 [Anisodus tanguticus]|uniref:Uncharacterized protein n=1 Tax=Anisodus tanguticus TaxID=243964 RepID=A0AAE1V224_9SOLA|nr:hypothetical protein RND71_035276 [Anisodus tanguticus]